MIGLVCFCLIISMLNVALWPVFLTDLGQIWLLDEKALGLISGFYFLGYVLATPVLVSWTDIVDAKKVFVIGSILLTASQLFLFFFAQGFWSALFILVLSGAGLAGTYMPGLQILNSRLDKKKRISMVPYYTACFSIGTAFSYAVMSLFLTNSNFAWATLTTSFSAFIAGLLITILIPNKPIISNKNREKRFFNFKPAFSNKLRISFIISYAAHNFELFAFRSWVVALFIFLNSNTLNGVSIINTGLILAVMTTLGTAASIFGAKLCLYFPRSRIISITGIITIAFATLSSFMLGGSLWPLVLAISVFYVCIMLDSSALTAGIVSNSDEQNRGSILAVYSTVGFSGSIIGPPTIGLILYLNGGISNLFAWKCALLAMAIGSIFVFFFQSKFFLSKQ